METELDKFLAESSPSRQSDPFLWWRDSATMSPVWSNIAASVPNAHESANELSARTKENACCPETWNAWCITVYSGEFIFDVNQYLLVIFTANMPLTCY